MRKNRKKTVKKRIKNASKTHKKRYKKIPQLRLRNFCF
jgi:hypothetical protein